MERGKRPDAAELRAYYDALPRQRGFASRCKMTFPQGLRGKRVLDLDCRRGRGVEKLSACVGAVGWALGTDPSAELIAIAEERKEAAWKKNGLPCCNLGYRVAFAEDLAAAGISSESFDAVFANSSLYVDFDPVLAFREAFRVLTPGGLLIFDGVVAEGARDAGVVARARKIGNCVQAAWSRAELERVLLAAGFDAPAYCEESPIAVDAGVEEGVSFPVVSGGGQIAFTKTTALAMRPAV